MRLASGNITANDTAAPLADAGVLTSRVILQNNGSVSVRVGSSDSQDLVVVAEGDYTIETPNGSTFDLSTVYVVTDSDEALVGWNAMIG